MTSFMLMTWVKRCNSFIKNQLEIGPFNLPYLEHKIRLLPQPVFFTILWECITSDKKKTHFTIQISRDISETGALRGLILIRMPFRCEKKSYANEEKRINKKANSKVNLKRGNKDGTTLTGNTALTWS